MKLIKFLFGVLLIAGLALCLGSGLTPPGVGGAVIRHNQDCQIDATALFYSDLENMQDLERDLAATRAAATLLESSPTLP